MVGSYILFCLNLEKCGKLLKNDLFTERLRPDWGNTFDFSLICLTFSLFVGQGVLKGRCLVNLGPSLYSRNLSFKKS